MRWRFLTLALGASVLAWSSAAFGYRPFVSTDAAVADPKEIEIELGYFTLERTRNENTFIIPRAVLNYGLFKNWEGVVEFAIQRASEAELDIIDPAISLKGVLKEGVLQDKDGFGFAVEASALLPSTEKGERRFGFEGIGILTDTLGPFTFHLNGGVGIERSTGDLVGIWGVIGELPLAKGVRLVGEINGEKPRREDQRDSVLLGVIWQPWSEKSLWFDAGIRRGFTGAAPDWQLTLGITFGFAASAPATSPAPEAELLRGTHASFGVR
jgi:hypothetical protein